MLESPRVAKMLAEARIFCPWAKFCNPYGIKRPFGMMPIVLLQASKAGGKISCLLSHGCYQPSAFPLVPLLLTLQRVLW